MATELVTRLCEQGLDAEAAGDLDGARALYQQAWDNADDAFEQSLAAHYRARVAQTDDDRVSWARQSVEFALHAADGGDDRIYPLLPTVRVTAASALLASGDVPGARDEFLSAAIGLRVAEDVVPQAALLRTVIFDGLTDCGMVHDAWCPEIEILIEKLKKDNAIGALAHVLSAFVAGIGTDAHGAEFAVALRDLAGTPAVTAEQRDLIGAAIGGIQRQLSDVSRTDRGGASASALPEAASGPVGEFGSAGSASSVYEPAPDVPFRL